MKNFAKLLTLTTVALSLTPQISSASSPHPGSGSLPPPVTFPIIGQFQAACAQGSATAESRNVVVGGHNQQVVYFATQANSTVEAVVLNLNSPKLSKPIRFNLVSGAGTDLVLVLRYSPPHTTVVITEEYGFPGQPKIFTGQRDLISNGHGSYEIPIGRSPTDIPSGSSVNSLFFNQGPSVNPDCVLKANAVNNLNLNGRNVGISTDAASATCTVDCVSAK